ncbi:AAA family ATPase [Exiguobacterium sp. SL-9]|uniref:AAA family ATPase n=1 Tax=Exiguobacterium sp. SL-9 TaxID=2510963 RepID=UPI00103EC399|nr:SMC family ATPase [Exiguobacterium sp. SL-9]TCI21916.1 SMC family ATPase [Exiguobacterium sp. SL-9]
MRPEQLTITAFGPYAETEQIDFTQLEGRSMFVISGRTGAGKTTIFDAMTFALYGRASGTLRNASDFRSQYADPNRKTEIDFSFTIRDERYRVVRQPQQPHPKNKTPIPHEAVLYEWKDAWKPMATKVNDVEQTIESLLQLSYEQFSQILLLPQNQFRQLLDSDSTKKQQILQSIFKTEAYRTFQEDWIERYGKYRKQVEWAVETTRLKLLELEDDAVEDISTRNLPEIVTWLDAREERLLASRDSLQEQRRAGEERLETLRRDVNQATTLAELIEERDMRARALETFREAATARKERQALIQRLEQVSSVNPLFQRTETVRHDIERLTRERDASQQRDEGYLKQLEGLKAEAETITAMRQEADQATSRVNAIDEMLPYVDEWHRATRRRDDLKRQVEPLSQFLEEARLKQLQATEIELAAKLEQAPAPEQLVEAERLYSQLQHQARLEAKVEEVTERLGDCERNGKEVQRQFTAQTERVEQFVEAEHARMADTLREQLETGEPCPVCGSLTHGHVERTETSVDQAGHRSAVETLKRIEAELHEARADYRSLKRQLDELTRERDLARLELKLDGQAITALQHQDARVRQLRQEADARQRNERLLRATTSELKKLETAKRTQADERQKLFEQLQHVQEQLQSMRQPDGTTLETLQTERSQLTTRLAHIEQKVAVYERRLEELNRLKWGEAERLRLLGEQLEFEQTRLSEATTELDAALEKLELTETVFKEYRARVEQLPELRERQASELEEGVRLEHAVKALNEKIGDRPRPDLERLQERLHEEGRSFEALSEQLMTADGQLKRHRHIVAEWNALRERTDKDQRNLETVKLIADTGRGINPQKLTFETYVQTAFFDQILHAANIHLDQMTSGQFQLERKIETAKGNAKSGLELLVFDAYTGQSRRVQNLSGGEGFKASLSLALGLAEVVQQLSGGVSLETMLIDEGFGTLDAESLDQAIELLMSLQSSGRLVGVISHVQELKDRVDARIEVKKSRSGSTIQLIVE